MALFHFLLNVFTHTRPPENILTL